MPHRKSTELSTDEVSYATDDLLETVFDFLGRLISALGTLLRIPDEFVAVQFQIYMTIADLW